MRMGRVGRAAALLFAAPFALAQQNSATVGDLGPFATAIAQGGTTVAAVLCTPLVPYQNLTLFDLATNQQLSSACEVTNRIEDFIRDLPGTVEDFASSVRQEVLGTSALLSDVASKVKTVVTNVKTNLGPLSLIGDSSINITAAAELFIDEAKKKLDKKKDSNGDTSPNSDSCTPATFLKGAELPTQCVGPVFTIKVDGGSCVTGLKTGKVKCTQPKVTLTKTAGACNIKYKSPDLITDVQCPDTTTYGKSQSGTFKKDAEVFNAARVFEVTDPTALDLSFFTSTSSASASPIPNDTPGLPDITIPPLDLSTGDLPDGLPGGLPSISGSVDISQEDNQNIAYAPAPSYHYGFDAQPQLQLGGQPLRG